MQPQTSSYTVSDLARNDHAFVGFPWSGARPVSGGVATFEMLSRLSAEQRNAISNVNPRASARDPVPGRFCISITNSVQNDPNWFRPRGYRGPIVIWFLDVSEPAEPPRIYCVIGSQQIRFFRARLHKIFLNGIFRTGHRRTLCYRSEPPRKKRSRELNVTSNRPNTNDIISVVYWI